MDRSDDEPREREPEDETRQNEKRKPVQGFWDEHVKTKKDNRKPQMSEDEKEEETTTGKKLERDTTHSEAAGGMEVDKEDERQESGDDEETNTDMEDVQQQENTPTQKVNSSRTGIPETTYIMGKKNKRRGQLDRMAESISPDKSTPIY